MDLVHYLKGGQIKRQEPLLDWWGLKIARAQQENHRWAEEKR